MSHHLRLRGSLLAVFVMTLALVPAATATATAGVMNITADTTLTEDHTGWIRIIADDVTLDCAGYKVIGTGDGDGISVDERANVTVRNCHVSGFGEGIDVERSTSVRIENNTVTGITVNAISVKDSGGNTIEKNHVHHNAGGETTTGISVGSPNNTISNNVVTHNQNVGIVVSSNGNTLDGNTVSDNGDFGIDLAGASNNIIRQNVATDNLVGGINLWSSESNNVSQNVADDNGGSGISLLYSPNNTVADNEASGNGGSGFFVVGSNGNSLAGNVASGNTMSGFSVVEGGPNSVADNDAHVNGEWGFRSRDNSDVVTFLDNRCIDNVNGGSDPSGLCDESGHFTDDDGTTFELDIEWMAREGITRGCNPPVNDLFCPGSSVSRGQMAAFLTRALELPAAPSAGFIDTVGSTFENDIDRLAAAGITRGCNPPANDRFCPDDPVRREVMAAFLVRALGYSDDGGGDLFTDDDGSIFETDIDKLATAGVTRGCNPPVNDRFCPGSNVTRGQMAAFLHRALG